MALEYLFAVDVVKNGLTYVGYSADVSDSKLKDALVFETIDLVNNDYASFAVEEYSSSKDKKIATCDLSGVEKVVNRLNEQRSAF